MREPNDLPEPAEGEALPAADAAAEVAATAEPLTAAPLHPSLPRDEFHGVAGSYVYDPVTGQRTRVS